MVRAADFLRLRPRRPRGRGKGEDERPSSTGCHHARAPRARFHGRRRVSIRGRMFGDRAALAAQRWQVVARRRRIGHRRGFARFWTTLENSSTTPRTRSPRKRARRWRRIHETWRTASPKAHDARRSARTRGPAHTGSTVIHEKGRPRWGPVRTSKSLGEGSKGDEERNRADLLTTLALVQTTCRRGGGG